MMANSYLDLGQYPELAVPARRSSHPAVVIGSTALGATFLIGFLGAVDSDSIAILFWRNFGQEAAVEASQEPMPSAQQSAVSAMTVDDKDQIVVAGIDAQNRNAQIPLSGLPIEQAGQFKLAVDAMGAAYTAQKCLTQAVYYEAANEPMQGRRAVAQVVLNRMRHPAYPKSVCGVVYEGSQRRTGCQFSFTCDGSLLRSPAARSWREAEDVARAALAGYVERSVGTATHYHADYVLPKWAFQLAKIEQLGRHIFYRFSGKWGRSGAFTGRYSGAEWIPSINYSALQARVLDEEGPIVTEQLVPGLTVAPHVTDRHAEADVGGRLDVTKEWRLNIPDPVQSNARYRAAVGEGTSDGKAADAIAAAEPTVTVPQP